MSIEAMKQALDFISRLKFPDAEPEPEVVMAILDKAIAEAEKQEPVAWIDDECEFQWIKKIDNPEHTAFYTHPQPKQPLTDDEIAEVAERMEASDPTDSFWRDFARAIEAAHGIKE